MATTAVTVEQYLRTSYRPDCDYVDGEVVERNFGEREHASTQMQVLGWFFNHEAAWKLVVLPEQRFQIDASRFRVPDVVVLAADAPDESIVKHPPMIAVEILSPEDRMNAVRSRLDDYLRVGVKNIWVLDPYQRLAWEYSASGYSPVERVFTVKDTEIDLPIAEAFAGLPPVLKPVLE